MHVKEEMPCSEKMNVIISFGLMNMFTMIAHVNIEFFYQNFYHTWTMQVKLARFRFVNLRVFSRLHLWAMGVMMFIIFFLHVFYLQFLCSNKLWCKFL